MKPKVLKPIQKFAVFFIILSSFSSFLYAASEKDPKWDFILPVNVLKNTKQKVNIAVKMPDSFKPVADYAKDIKPKELIEFIPKDDKSVDDWSKIITLKSFPGIAIKSNKEYLDAIEAGFKDNAVKYELLEGDDKKQEGFEEGYRIISYSYNNRDEVVYIYSASGPEDTAMVQYAIKLSSPADLDKAKEELKTFMKDNVTKT